MFPNEISFVGARACRMKTKFSWQVDCIDIIHNQKEVIYAKSE
jgi:hypothetical protein